MSSPLRAIQQVQPELHVRRHERLECRLGGFAQVAPEFAAAVRIARAAAHINGIAVTVVDCSAGGLGLSSEVFLPRGCELLVRAPIPLQETGGDGGALTFEAMVRVQRVAMVDRQPAYYIGASFVNLAADQRRSIECLLEAIRRGSIGASPNGATTSDPNLARSGSATTPDNGEPGGPRAI